MKFFTWDAGIIAAFALLLSYSLLIRKHKALATLVSVYISYVVVAGWGDRVAAFFSGDRVAFNQVWIKVNLTPFAVKAGALVLLTIILSSFLKLGGRRSRYGVAEVVAYTLGAVVMAVMAIVAFMPPTVLAGALADSMAIKYLYMGRDWLPLVPVVFMLFFGMYGGDDL